LQGMRSITTWKILSMNDGKSVRGNWADERGGISTSKRWQKQRHMEAQTQRSRPVERQMILRKETDPPDAVKDTPPHWGKEARGGNYRTVSNHSFKKFN